MPRFLRYLKTQIIFAMLSLTALVAVSALYSIYVIEQQHGDDVMLHLVGQLQFHQQHLTIQAMQYRDNAPRDHASYDRDLGLYFQDLKRTRSELAKIVLAFATNRFDGVMSEGEKSMMSPVLPKKTQPFAEALAKVWQDFDEALTEKLGNDPQEPRLEWAAGLINEQHGILESTSADLLASLEQEVAERAARAQAVNKIMLVSATLVAAGIALWFYLRVLQPMSTAVLGFSKVANGDFSYQVPITDDNEIGWMVSAFNRLSNRLDTLRRILTRLEQGDDLDGTLRTLSETLPKLIPVDWIGALIIGTDGRIHLQKAFSDGEPDPIGLHSFITDKTLLEECIETRQPLHIPDVTAMADLTDDYVFLKRLSERGRRDAIFMPIGSGSKVQGVVVFASRFPNSYRSEHLELLQNIGVLVGVSLARTIQLAESARLANIGQFASGIAHEIRNPLATISLALDHVGAMEGLPANSAKRVHLANDEIRRLEGLLADILLYAKPLTLDRSTYDLETLLREMIEAEGHGNSQFEVEISHCPPALIDVDRIRQVLINLLRNAEQASPDGLPISIRCRSDHENRIEIEIANSGDAIPPGILERVFEPFVTSKSRGTGLGLPIVKRIVESHGGDIMITSDTQNGTRVTLRLPTADAANAARVQAAVLD